MAERRLLPLPAIVAATALALVAALGALALTSPDDDDASADGTDEGYELTPAGELPSSLEEVRLVALDGGDDRSLGEFTGRTPVVVNFFGSWCVPCVEEMPAFEAVHQSVGGQVTFLGLANRDPAERALATVEATGVTYPTFNDPDTSALTYFGALNMPASVFIDGTGEVVDVHSGPLTEAALRAKLTDLFGVTA